LLFISDNRLQCRIYLLAIGFKRQRRGNLRNCRVTFVRRKPVLPVVNRSTNCDAAIGQDDLPRVIISGSLKASVTFCAAENVVGPIVFYFLMTGLHAFHMIIGEGILCAMLFRTLLGSFSQRYHTPVELAGLYWHFVDTVWVFLFAIFYIPGAHMK
jgi:hypothetical protein